MLFPEGLVVVDTEGVEPVVVDTVTGDVDVDSVTGLLLVVSSVTIVGVLVVVEVVVDSVDVALFLKLHIQIIFIYIIKYYNNIRCKRL